MGTSPVINKRNFYIDDIYTIYLHQTIYVIDLKKKCRQKKKKTKK